MIFILVYGICEEIKRNILKLWLVNLYVSNIAYTFHKQLFKVYSRAYFVEWLIHDEKALKKALETMKEWRNIVLGSSPTAGLLST